MKWFLLPLLFGGVAFAAPLDEARKAYESGNADEAIRLLEAMPEKPVSAEVQGALGAAWFKKGDVGKSIFHFRRASQLRPRDADVRYNLGFARKSAKDKLDTSGGLLSLPFSEKELGTFAALLSLLAGIAGAAWLGTRRGWVKGVAWALTSFALLGTVGALVANGTNRPFGVVTAGEAAVRSGPGETYTHLFTLHAGAEFDLLASKDSWAQIRLSDGKVGWVDEKLTVL